MSSQERPAATGRGAAAEQAETPGEGREGDEHRMSDLTPAEMAEELVVLHRRVRAWPETDLSLMVRSPQGGNAWRGADPSFVEYALAAINYAGFVAASLRDAAVSSLPAKEHGR